MRHADPRAARVISLFETLAPGDVARLGQFYTPDATFKDPFNEVRGSAEIQLIFAHMFVAVDAPRFVIHDVIVQGEQCVGLPRPAQGAGLLADQGGADQPGGVNVFRSRR